MLDPLVQEERRPAPALLRRHIIPAIALLAVAFATTVRFGGPLLSGTRGGDVVAQREIQERTVAFAAMRPLPLQLVPPERRAEAIASLGLATKAQSKIAADVQAERVRLAYLTVFDSDAEDGDAVTIVSAGFSRSLVLTKAPVTLAFPVPSNGVVEITGIVDGEGGGVTLGIITPAGPLPLPPMAVGQTIRLPVAAQ